jgi:hypothetical protein
MRHSHSENLDQGIFYCCGSKKSNSAGALAVLQMWTRKCVFFSLFVYVPVNSLHCLRNQVPGDGLSNVPISLRSNISHQEIITPWHRLLPLSGSHKGGGGCVQGKVPYDPDLMVSQGHVQPFSMITLYARMVIGRYRYIKLIRGHNLSRNTARWYYSYMRTVFDFFFFFVSILQDVKLTLISQP